MPLEAPDAQVGSPDIVVHVQQRPDWAVAALDASRTIFAARPADPDANLLDVGWTIGGAGIRMRYAEGATFWIGAALDEIWLTYDPPLTAADAAHFLLEPVLAFVLRLRGVLVLHASAVEIAGRGVVFCGAAGAGKSTTAGACVAAGAALLSDDVVAVTRRSGQWIAHRGTPALRVWDDGAAALTGDARNVPRFSPTWDKRVIDPTAIGGRPPADETPIGLICVIADRLPRESGAAPALVPLSPRAALGAVLPHTAANYLHDNERRAVELVQLAGLLRAVPAASLVVRDDAAHLAAIADAVARHVGG